MAKYHYDEAGNMAAYFLLTFLALILIPFSLSLFNSQSMSDRYLRIQFILISSAGTLLDGCDCKPCLERRRSVNPLLKPYMSKKLYFSVRHDFWHSSSSRTYLLVIGWSLFGYISYKVANAKLDNTVYDPFEILGIRLVSPDCPSFLHLQT
jgi:translocation protein SEC63